MSYLVDYALKFISFLKPHKLIFPNDYRKTAEHIKLYEDLFGNDKSKKRSNNDRILNSVLVESIFGKAYKKKQIKELIKLIDDPNNGISLKIIKSSSKFLKFNDDNKPYVEFSDNDNFAHKFALYLIAILILLIPLIMFYGQYFFKSKSDNLIVSIIEIIIAFFTLILIYGISDSLDAKVLKKQLENAD